MSFAQKLIDIHPDHKALVALARKRAILKRYLTLSEVEFDINWTTSQLQCLVRQLHQNRGKMRHAWPMNHNSIDQLSIENHYVRQLLAMKRIFGIKSQIGVVIEDKTTVMCQTVADLVKIGCADTRFLAIDANIQRLVLKTKNNACIHSLQEVVDG